MQPRLRSLFFRRPLVVTSFALAGAGLAAASVLTNLPLPTTSADFHQPGTQPNTLSNSIVDSTGCTGCHSGYDEAQEPYTRWAASMMGQAGRDPVFYAAMTIANQDAANAGELCLRCHASGAWLDGRCTPADGSALDPNLGDLDGVTCNLCHRMVDPIYQPGVSPLADQGILAALTEPPVSSPHSAQFVVDPNDVRRGPFDLGPSFYYHDWEPSPFHRDARQCGTCHDVSNPAFSKQPDGTYKLNPVNQPHPTQLKTDEFPVERTYSEWTQTDYAKRPIDTGGRFGGDKNLVSTCMDCHMPKITGTAAQPVLGAVVRPDLAQHNFNGSNSWVLDAVRNLYPDSETGLSANSVAANHRRNQEMLEDAIDLELSSAGGELGVRLVNHCGHKLPTGYGEGRRIWINVRFLDGLGQLVAERGAYDTGTAVLNSGDTKVYEILHGLDAYMSGVTGLPAGHTFHFALNNEVLKDNRIPPRGFTHAGFAAIQDEPFAASYAEQQYWDDTHFTIPAGAVRAEVRVYHQTTSKEYIEFLLNENTTDNRGQVAYNQWLATGKSRPLLMRAGSIDLGAPSCNAPVLYGLAKRLSNGRTPALSSSGSPSVSGPGLQLHVVSGMPNQLALALWSPVSASLPFNGGTLYLGNPTQRLPAITLGATGTGTIPVPLAPGMAGSARNYQVVMRDPGDAFGIGLTNAVHVDFCQ